MDLRDQSGLLYRGSKEESRI